MANEKKTPKSLKPIRSSRAIEKKNQNSLKEFTAEIIKSVHYWSLAQFNKRNRGEIENLPFYLRKEFNALKKQWQSNANEVARDIAKRQINEIVHYVDSNMESQGREYKLKPSKATLELLKAHYLENVELIKSIPSEIIKRYESSLYNMINDFDAGAIKKSLQVITGISKRRAELIGRDQVSKAIESYASAKAQDLGFEYYIWETAHDERVSKGKGGHDKLQGRIYRYDTPSAIIDSYGNKGHPSIRVNCRCTKRALILEPNQKLKLVRDSNAGDFYEIV